MLKLITYQQTYGTEELELIASKNDMEFTDNNTFSIGETVGHLKNDESSEGMAIFIMTDIDQKMNAVWKCVWVDGSISASEKTEG